MDYLEPGSEDPKARELRVLADSLTHAAKLVASFAGGAVTSAPAAVPVVLRVKQIAPMLGVGERAVRKMMDRGDLPWVFIGRQRVVPVAIWMDRLASRARANDASCVR